MQIDIPFEITPQVRRFLDELTFPTEFDSGGGRNIVQVFDIGERLSHGAFANIEKFLKFLQKEKLIKLDEAPKMVKTDDSTAVRPKILKIAVLDEHGLQDLTDYINQKQSKKLKDSKIRWRLLTRTVIFGEIKLTFQRRSAKRILLFDTLWNKQRRIVSKEVITLGEPTDPRELAARLGLTQNRRHDRYNDGGIQAVGDKAKELGRQLKDKGLPITITTKGGVQMIVSQ